MKTNIILDQRQGLGDIIGTTAVVRDFYLQHGDKFNVMVHTGWRSIWHNNPYISSLNYDEPHQLIKMDYSASFQKAKNGEHIHFLRGLVEIVENHLNIKIKLTQPKGDIHLTDEEKEPILSGRYWIITSGGKFDMTVKHWPTEYYQKVVDTLLENNIKCVQVGETSPRHFHPPLKNVLNLIGETADVRDLCNIVMHCDGVICPITSLMHLAAVYDKPCIVIAGGREEPWWISYTNEYHGAFGFMCKPVRTPHKVLHTVGKLPCCEKSGCHNRKVVALTKDDMYMARLCEKPDLSRAEQAIASCMSQITPEEVIEKVLDYYKEGIIDKAKFFKKCIVYDDVVRIKQPSAPKKYPANPTGLLPPPIKPIQLVDDPIFDHPLIGGNFTVFVLCYGDFVNLAKRCLSPLVNSVDRGRMDLRVIANAPGEATINYLKQLDLDSLTIYNENKYKYPAMREAFFNTTRTINSQYIIWFDDDSYVNRSDWLRELAKAIINNHLHGYRLYGWHHFHNLRIYQTANHDPKKWFIESSWWRNRPFRVDRQMILSHETGTCIDFVVGGFWAIDFNVVRSMNIPDERLVHNGGDITIGAMVHQAGFKVFNFSPNNSVITINDYKRRGYSEKFPWCSA